MPLNYKGRNSNDNGGTCRDHFNQVIKVIIVRNDIRAHDVSPKNV